MMKPYPTYRQREVLQFLMQGDWVPILKLIPVGDKLLGNLLHAGWIERSPDLSTGDLYRITEAGRIAFRTLCQSSKTTRGSIVGRSCPI